MGKPDALLRRADHGEGLSSDNEDITLLQPDVFRIHALAGLMITGEEASILRDIRHSTREANLEEPVAIVAHKLQRSPSRRSVQSADWALKAVLCWSLTGRRQSVRSPGSDFRQRWTT